MNTQRINITLPADLIRDLRRIVPEGKRSRFLADALEEKIIKRKNLKKDLAKSLRANYEYYKKVGKEIEEDFKYADADVLKNLP